MKKIFFMLILGTCCKSMPTEQTEILPILRWEAAGSPSGTPGGPCLYITVASKIKTEPGQISLAIKAHDLENVTEITGGLVFSRTVLEYISWSAGNWFDEADHYSIAYKEGLVVFESRRLQPKSGNGEIIIFTFRAVKDGEKSTRILWYTPRVNGDSVAVLGGAVYVGY